jgi:hypothetical protein
MGLNITAMSYLGLLDFGIVADREQMPDVWSLIGWLGDALAELGPVGRPDKPRVKTGHGNGTRKPARTKPKAKQGSGRSG